MAAKILKYIQLIALALLLLMPACNKEKQKVPIVLNNYLEDVADYFCFKVGTYWIYQNDMTGEVDSQWVTGLQRYQTTQKGTEEYSKHITLNSEVFQLNIASNFVDGYGGKSRWEVYGIGPSPNGYPTVTMGYLVEKRKIHPTFGTIQDVFVKPYYTSDKHSVYQSALITNYELNGFVYDTVRVFKVRNDGVFQESKITVGPSNSDYYYAKKNGLIKVYVQGFKELDRTPLNQTWSVIRKKIVQ